MIFLFYWELRRAGEYEVPAFNMGATVRVPCECPVGK